MKKTVLLSVVLAICVFFQPALSVFFAPQELVSDGAIGRWRPLVHLSHNAYLMWHEDTFSRLIDWAGVAGGTSRTAASLWIIFGSGLIGLFVLCVGSGRSLQVLVLAVSFLSLTANCVGRDLVFLGAVAWFPWLVLAVWKALERLGQPAALLSLLLVGVLQAMDAQHLSLFMAAIAVVAGALLAWPRTQAIPYVASISILPAVFVLALIPAVPVPDYPALAHVVPDDGLPGMVRPLLGMDTVIPVIDRNWLKLAYQPVAIGAALLCLLVGVLQIRQLNQSGLRLLLASYAALLLVLLDVCFGESASLIAPLASISRILPNAFLFPLAPLMLTVGVLIGLMALLRSQRVAAALFLQVCLVLGVQLHDEGRPILERRESEAAVAALSPAEREKFRPILVSPSLPLVVEYGAWILEQRERIQNPDFTPLDRAGLVVGTYPAKGIGKFTRAMDGNPGTRWSPGGGRQTGNEWIQIFFEEPRTLSGLQLSAGKFRSDFPRGLRLSYRPSCGRDSGEPFEGYREIFDAPQWPGQLAFTALGFPYYGSQAQVEVIFPERIEVQCLLIQQTASFDGFDWSVAEISTAS